MRCLNYGLAIITKRLVSTTGEIAMQGHRISQIVLLVAVIGCCVAMAQEVQGIFLLGTDFSKYHSYKWVSIEGRAYTNQLVDAQIKQSVDSQLASKGLTKTDNDKADLYVAYQIAVDQVQQWKGYGAGGGPLWGGMAHGAISTMDAGTLILDMYDTSAKQLVWTGTATKALDPSGNQEKGMENLNKAAQRLLKNYPPK